MQQTNETTAVETAPATQETAALAAKPEKKPQTLKQLLNSDAIKDQIAKALPKHLAPERMMRVITTAMTRTPELQKCEQVSFMKCVLELSQYGLEPDGRHAHLIPFRNNKRNVVECQLIIDFKGLVKLVRQSGDVSDIHADIVCENDVFEENLGKVTRHQIERRKPRGAVFAAYTMVTLKDGTTSFCVMSRDEIEAIRKRSKAGNSGPWVTDWNEMAKKTVFRRHSKWLPLSVEVIRAIEADDDQFALRNVTPSAKPAKALTLVSMDTEGGDA